MSRTLEIRLQYAEEFVRDVSDDTLAQVAGDDVVQKVRELLANEDADEE